MEYDHEDIVLVTDLEFLDRADAILFMEEKYADDNMDNVRVADAEDDNQLEAYWFRWSRGCCGYYDAYVKIGGRLHLIGCNYGH